MVPAPSIITCKQWGARQPKTRPIVTGRPDKIIVHHTDGHAPYEVAPEAQTNKSAIAYARQLQDDMMDKRGWNDSGHNFLVMRSGLILQGRWGTVAAIERGRMVVSAHCPGQNSNPGIEHEHLPGELLTDQQKAATVALMAWICDRCGIPPTSIYGHGIFYPTECPSNLTADVLPLRLLVAGKLAYYGRSKAKSARFVNGLRLLRSERKR